MPALLWGGDESTTAAPNFIHLHSCPLTFRKLRHKIIQVLPLILKPSVNSCLSNTSTLQIRKLRASSQKINTTNDKPNLSRPSVSANKIYMYNKHWKLCLSVHLIYKGNKQVSKTTAKSRHRLQIFNST